jgi:Fur family ferric uptake transcriptional regulator
VLCLRGAVPAAAYGEHMDLSEIHEIATTRLRKDHQRYTSKRQALVEVLHRAGRPLSMPAIMEQSPEMAQSSVYRNLAVLEQASIVRRIVTLDDHASFELTEDLSHHHHHLICSSCGTIEDFDVPPAFESDLARTLKSVGRRHRFNVTAHVFDIFGTCERCSATA